MRLPVAILAASLVLGALACGGSSERADAPSQLVGVIAEVERNGADVSAFVLRTDDETYEILIADDVDYGFDLEHLDEHRATGDPVRVRLEERDGGLYALEIADA